MEDLLSALEVFSRAPDKAAIERANSWLQDFQHSPEAWLTCNNILASSDAPISAKLFAAQTFRTKVTYDLNQVSAENLISLRDTILAALQQYHAGPKTIVTQLCLALSGLALQLPSWQNAVPFVIEKFGQNPITVPTLLQFLTLLPEELTGNTRIPITDADYREQSEILLSNNSKQVLQLLSVYIQAPGVTHAIQAQVFECLRSWLVCGEVLTSDLAATPLLSFSFEALQSNDLFDAAVDVICEMIHETQEVDDNMPVIELIVPRVIALRPRLQLDKNEEEKIRGYARIFAEAGETYRMLLLLHIETFYPIVEAIGECSAYPDLDIVPITFQFWMRLAQSIGKRTDTSPLLIETYKSLMTVIISHLHFPADPETMSGQDAENFRSFRHIMGDTLKDCCHVLGVGTCLTATYALVTSALSQPENAQSWQAIEAPLFAMRSMGAQLDASDNAIVPKIMDLIPSLPQHPRVCYAALLIISRYTEWINMHPQYIQAQLQYVAAGFENPDSEVSAASGHALKYLCQDCKQHLVEFLPTLHTFLSTTGSKLAQEDKRMVYEAIAHVISAMPMENAADALKTFSVDILAQVHTVTAQSAPSKADLNIVGDGLENLETMLSVIRTFGEVLPMACQGACQNYWAIMDAFIEKFANDFELSEKVTRVLRHGLVFFGDSAATVAPAMLSRMTIAFETSGFPSYMWISGKIVGMFGESNDTSIRNAFREVFERSTTKVVTLLQNQEPEAIPDVIQDHTQMLLQLAENAPDVFYPSPAFPLAFRATMTALTLVHSEIIFAALELFRVIITHDCLLPSVNPPPSFPIFASAINNSVIKDGLDFIHSLITGLVGDFPEDSASLVIAIFRSMTAVWSSQVLAWLPIALDKVPISLASVSAKNQFINDVTDAVHTRQFDKAKYAILGLSRTSRKAVDRRRTSNFR